METREIASQINRLGVPGPTSRISTNTSNKTQTNVLRSVFSRSNARKMMLLQLLKERKQSFNSTKKIIASKSGSILTTLDPISNGVLTFTMLKTSMTFQTSLNLASTTKCRRLKLESMLLLMYSNMGLTLDVDGQFTAHIKARKAFTMIQ